MTCKYCYSNRILDFTAKCSDTFYCSIGGTEHYDYVPADLGIGNGNYIDISMCLDCGKVRGNFPKPISKLEEDVSDEEIKEFYLNHFSEETSLYIPDKLKDYILKDAKSLCSKFENYMDKFIYHNSSFEYKHLKMPHVNEFIKMYRDGKLHIEGVE